MHRTAVMLSLAWVCSASGLDLSPIPDDTAKEIGKALTGLAAKVEKLPVKVEADLDNLKGLVSDDQMHGLLVVPAKGIKEDRENPGLSKDKGMPIGVIYFYNLLPTELKDKKALPEVKFTDPDAGLTREIRFGFLTVKKNDDSDYRLQLWGIGDKPVAETNLSEDAGDSKAPIELDFSGDELEILLLGKFPSTLPLKTVKF